MKLRSESRPSENNLDSFWLKQIDLFIAYRRVLGFIVMQDWLDKKPTTRRSWKKMIMEEPPIMRETF